MRRQDIDVTVETSARPEDVFRLLLDGSTWPTWSPIDSFELEREAPAGGEGLDAVRVFHTGRHVSRERVAEIVTDRRFSYVLLSGLPVRDYRADVDLAPAPSGGTSIRWHSTFVAKMPGTGGIIRRRLGDFIEQCARGLGDYAAARTNA